MMKIFQIFPHIIDIISFRVNSNKEKINIPIKEIYSDSGNVFKFVLDDNQKIWFSSTTLKLSSYDLKSGRVESFQILERKSTTGGGESILDLEYIPKNKVVISTNIGGYIFNTVSKSIEPLPSTMNRKYSNEFMSFVKKKLNEIRKKATVMKKYRHLQRASNDLILENRLVCFESKHDQGLHFSVVRKDHRFPPGGCLQEQRRSFLINF